MMMYTLTVSTHFNSLWKRVRQYALLMYCDIVHGRLTTVDRKLTAWSLISTALANELVVEQR